MKGTIVFYISGHGHGHAVRQSILINEIPAHIPVHITSLVEKRFFRRNTASLYLLPKKF